MIPYKIHHRKINLSGYMEAENYRVFREEEDQGYYLQAIVPFTTVEAIAVFRRDTPDEKD